MKKKEFLILIPPRINVKNLKTRYLPNSNIEKKKTQHRVTYKQKKLKFTFCYWYLQWHITCIHTIKNDWHIFFRMFNCFYTSWFVQKSFLHLFSIMLDIKIILWNITSLYNLWNSCFSSSVFALFLLSFSSIQVSHLSCFVYLGAFTCEKCSFKI